MKRQDVVTEQAADLDGDVSELSRGDLEAEVRRLRNAIRRHRDESGQRLCWHQPQLWGALPESVDPLPAVPAWPEFLRGCVAYRESLDKQLPSAARSTEEYRAKP